jgi:(p)ppGpp synthase/HD superfamily hydrolase
MTIFYVNGPTSPTCADGVSVPVPPPLVTLSANPVSKVLEAALFAAEKHRHQRRKDHAATPYINHPLGVAKIMCEAGIEDVDVLVAALLHDTVEDTETTPSELAERFGPRVASLVAEVTDDKSLLKAERKRLQVATAADKSDGARLIKIADKIANLRDLADHPPAWDDERMEAYRVFSAEVIAQATGVSAQLDAMAAAELVKRSAK